MIKGAGAYICGEETALLASIEGQRPEVRVRPPFPTVEGLFRKPTIVNNVETFANIHSILTLGGVAYAKIGTAQSSGPKLVSLDSNFRRPGLYECAMGTPMKTVVHELGGGFKVPVKAIQVGGPLGGLLPVAKIEELTLDFESFKNAGFLLGHAGVVSIPESFPMIEYIEHLFQFTSDESCGKCFPCRLGSTRGAGTRREVTRRRNGGTHRSGTDSRSARHYGKHVALCARRRCSPADQERSPLFSGRTAALFQLQPVLNGPVRVLI